MSDAQPRMLQLWGEFAVEVVRSKKRRKTVGAQIIGDTLRVSIPSWMSHAEEVHWVDEMSRRFARRTSCARISLPTRAAELAERYALPYPNTIRWVENMESRWGSCTISTREIRLSSRLGPFPDWVVDYVIVHELAHLLHADHSAAFWAVVHQYPKAERAIGYLIAKSGDVC